MFVILVGPKRDISRDGWLVAGSSLPSLGSRRPWGGWPRTAFFDVICVLGPDKDFYGYAWAGKYGVLLIYISWTPRWLLSVTCLTGRRLFSKLETRGSSSLS